MNSLLNRRSVLALAGGALVASRVAWPKVAQPGDSTVPKSIDSNCGAYLDAWSHKDLDGIAVHLHPDVHFKGPMQELNGIGVCRTAELVRFQDGLIRDIELFFDARPFEAMQRSQADRATPK